MNGWIDIVDNMLRINKLEVEGEHEVFICLFIEL